MSGFVNAEDVIVRHWFARKLTRSTDRVGTVHAFAVKRLERDNDKCPIWLLKVFDFHKYLVAEELKPISGIRELF